MTGPWKIVGTSSTTPVERDVSAFRLEGDVSALTVPLAWPLPKRLEEFLPFNGPDKIRILWQSLVAQSEYPEHAGYVPFPDDVDDLHEIYTKPDGSPTEFPWDKPGNADFPTPTNWQMLLGNWYMEQQYYGRRDFIKAFGDAVEAQIGLPLEQSAPLLHTYMQSEGSGVDVSESKPVSTSKTNQTGRKSGPRRTTSSPAA